MTRRRILVVAYNFPPSGVIGTMRTLRLVERLAADGWIVTVLTAKPATYLPDDPVDVELLARVPAGVEVLASPVFRPMRALTEASRPVLQKLGHPRLIQSMPENPTPDSTTASKRQSLWRGLGGRVIKGVDVLSSLPDQEAGWIAPAFVAGLRWSFKARPDLVYSTAPPWSAHVLGLALASAVRRRWVADFRDPWSRRPWTEHQSPIQLRAWKRLERMVVSRANALVFNTRRTLEEFSSFYGQGITIKTHLVPNGCDAVSFGVPARPASGKFVLLHAGSLYGARSPLLLIKAVGACIRRGVINPDRFTLRLLGTSTLPPDVTAAIVDLGLEQVVELEARVSRQRSIEEITKASALLVLQPSHALSIPAKTYEYLASGRPILAIADEGETSQLLRDSGAGIVAASTDAAAIEGALEQVIGMASTGVRPVSRELYDGSMRAAELVAILAGVIDSSQEPTVPVSAPTIGGSNHV
jgi:glycosyltransferase involved in cell wall biosynthesis